MAGEEKRALVREIIKCARKCKNMTQTELAKAAGVTVAAIGFWESGATKSIKKVNRNAVAEVLGIDKRLLAYDPSSTALQRSYLEQFNKFKEKFEVQPPLPDLLVATDN